jgi:hypothetical protein
MSKTNPTPEQPGVPTSRVTTETEYYGSHNIERTEDKAGHTSTKLTLVPSVYDYVWSNSFGRRGGEPKTYVINSAPQYKGLTVVEQQNLDRQTTARTVAEHAAISSQANERLENKIAHHFRLTALGFAAVAVASIINLISLFI